MMLKRTFQMKIYSEDVELRVNVKERIEFRHKITEKSSLQIKWILWAKKIKIIRIMYQKQFEYSLELLKV